MFQSLLRRWRRPAPATAPPVAAPLLEQHDASWGNVTVYFVHTFTTKKPIVLGRAVHKLLRSEVARTAAWPSEEVVRLSPKLAQVDRSAVVLRRMKAWADDPSWPSLSRLFLRHPVMVMKMLASIAHPPADDPESNESVDLDDSIDGVERMLVEQQKILVMERATERDLFSHELTIDDPFVRLQMRGSYHTVLVGDEEIRVVFEPRLLLHRDGAVQITVGVSVPPGLNTSQLIGAIQPDSPILSHSEIPEPYAGRKSRWSGGEWAEDLDAGTRMRVIDHEEPASFFDWVDMAEARVLSLIGASKDGTGLVYPVTMAEAGACCDNWESNHQHDVAQVTTLSLPASEEQLVYAPGPNMAASTGRLMHAEFGSALIVELRTWQPGADDLGYTLLFERTVLLFLRMRALEKKLVAVFTKPRDVRRTYRAALELEQEARGGHILHGSARDLAAHVLAALGAPGMLEVIGRGVTIMGERAATRASEKAARTANRFAAVSLLVAFVAAVPAIPSILDFVAAQRQANPDITAWSVVGELLASPLQLSVVLLGVFAGVFLLNGLILAVKVIRVLWSYRKRGKASQVRGWRILPTGEGDEIRNRGSL
ncbi:hypothetical protein [Microbacterium paraoxydans]|uniref:hypothetical protein n=1 Tax=Microbacterium paraoxydans TaxID=199592 RepID=UPI0011A2AB4A|nr:hypothetical protein [Microbacterium paraoxydans]